MMMGIWIRQLLAGRCWRWLSCCTGCGIAGAGRRKPAFFLSARSTIQGYCTAVVRAALDSARLPYQMDIQPWAYLYHHAGQARNTDVSGGQNGGAGRQVSLDRPAGCQPHCLFRKKGRHDVVVHSLDDARHYRIGVVNMDFREEYLRRKGFGEAGSQPLMVVNSSDLLLPMLQAGRIDLIPLGLAKCAPHGLDCNAIEPVMCSASWNPRSTWYSAAIPAMRWYSKCARALNKPGATGSVARIMAPLNRIYGRGE
jgi:polar amino acid transport system substrate-binding protein